FDLSLLLSKWGTADSTADINDDNSVGILDLSILLSSWGPIATAGVPTPLSGHWRSDIESVPLGTPQYVNGQPNASSTALKQQWTWFGQPGQEDQYGLPQIVSAAAEGIAPPPGGDKVIKLHHPLGDPAVHHKLYKSFGAATFPSGAEPWDPHAPADVSGRYIAYQYVPSSKFSMTSHGWVNMLQFKESVQTQDGWKQNPSWWVGVGTGGPYQYTVSLGSWCCGGQHPNGKFYDFAPYMDKWVKWEFRVYQGNRLEWYLDDKLMDTGLNSSWPVGRMCQVGSPYSGAIATECREWVLGAGNYTSNQVMSGPGGNQPDYNYIDTTVYVDLAAYLPLP
ncbi:MAG: hypothetical protein K0S68_1085, partial [Candidatus Saccharibacteria bacterium]|nr:hypothetical protein [Candidatus Saccharibacteria bacterium]